MVSLDFFVCCASVVSHFSVLHPVRPAQLSEDNPQLRCVILQLCPTHSSSQLNKEYSRTKFSVLLAFEISAFYKQFSPSIPSRLAAFAVAVFLLRSLLPLCCFFCSLACSHPDSHLMRLRWHTATERRNASCYRDQFFLLPLPTSSTESNEVERSSVATDPVTKLASLAESPLARLPPNNPNNPNLPITATPLHLSYTQRMSAHAVSRCCAAGCIASRTTAAAIDVQRTAQQHTQPQAGQAAAALANMHQQSLTHPPSAIDSDAGRQQFFAASLVQQRLTEACASYSAAIDALQKARQTPRQQRLQRWRIKAIAKDTPFWRLSTIALSHRFDARRLFSLTSGEAARHQARGH
jgi:hypothetical protein